jgi:HK97 family phage major capsid protein
VTDTDPTFESVQFDVQTLIALVRVSRELVEDSVNIDAILGRAFAQALSLELDRVALIGSGTAPEPQGLRTLTNVNEVSLGTNGAAITNYDEILDAIQLMDEDNAEDPTAAIMAPRTATTIAKFAATDNQPLQRPPSIASLRFFKTTQIPIDETQGTASDASHITLGNFRRLMIGMRTSLRIELLRERYADAFQFGFLAFLRADVQVEHPESFARVIGIIP